MGTVLIDYRSISWGGPNEDDNNNVWALLDSSSDPGSVQLLNLGSVGDPVVDFPAPPTYPLGPNTLDFAFWNATNGTDALPGFPSADSQRKLNVPLQPGRTIVHATAWYAPPPGRGTGKPGLRARTFDVDLNGFRKETPIQSAAPPAAWPGPNNHTVSTAGAAGSATPKAHLLYPAPLSSQPPGEPPKEFKHWQGIVGSISVNAATKAATCAKGSSALALAFFGHSVGQQALGKPGYWAAFDYWAEFWGRRGAEGEGPFGPGGPGDPWEHLVARLIAALPPEQLRGRLQREIANLQAMVDKMGKTGKK
jgi:hypothetical protein